MSKRQSASLQGSSVTQDRLINALNLGQKSDGITPVYGIVRAINDDGSFGVQLSVSADLTRCAPFCYANIGDRVLVLIFNGKCAAIARDNTGLATNQIETTGLSASEIATKNLTASGTLHLTNTQDANPAADNNVALIVGPRTGTHIIMDTNEIICKSSATAYDNLWLAGSKIGMSSTATYLELNGRRGYLCQYGSVDISPTANTPTSKTITFPYSFASAPRVMATARSSVAGTTVKGVGVTSLGSSSCLIYVTRSNTTTTTVDWVAAGPM